ncbi:MAG: sugar ABC transporter ATP-binding protein [Armatimonadetes bacterium]|nr:sugar ABC transporter ATP-binding protein [Armatimonadota bacterium]
MSAAPASQRPLLLMHAIRKHFGGVQALRGVDLELRPGEVLALVGENGAGKSTLMEILCGNLRADGGRIEYQGRAVHFAGAREAAFAGVSIVHQELSLVPYLTVAENIYCAREPVYPVIGFVNRKRLYREAAEILRRFDLHVAPNAQVGGLPVAVQQMIEIAKALSLDCRVLVLDEPTSALTDRETRFLFEIIGRLRERGVAVIYISHKLDEVFRIADRVMVLRDGELVGTRPRAEVTPDDVVRMMVGRELGTGYPARDNERGEPLLRVEGLTREPRFRDVSFALHAGEIVGLAGLVGAGRTEVARAIFGIDRPQRGAIYLDGAPVGIRDPGQAVKLGIGYVPEDRKEQGLFLGLTVRQNVGAASLRENSVGGFMSPWREQRLAEEYVQRLRIRTPGTQAVASTLSGGNQQKVLLAKWLAIRPRILLVDEPTRGVDVGAKAEVHGILRELARAGVAVLMVSSELPEVLGASDRILVMHEGEITGELSAEEATEERVMFLAAGRRAGAA